MLGILWLVSLAPSCWKVRTAAPMETRMALIIAPDDPGSEVLNENLTAEVMKVFDGDGFLANAWEPIRGDWVKRVPFRFAFIDAPEMQQPYGAESREFLRSLIAGKTLQLIPIFKESGGDMPIDQYNRMLCMAFLNEQMQIGEVEYYLAGRCGTGMVKYARPVLRNVELEMIVNGWAWVMEQYTFEREDEYFEAQEDAKRNRRGLWAVENPEPPWEYKRRQRRRRKSDDRQPSLFSGANTQCPIDECGGHLVERMSMQSQFLGCSNFPRCRYSRDGGV